jgi:pimeloyl-ACP methyl ester carboxylesterase
MVIVAAALLISVIYMVIYALFAGPKLPPEIDTILDEVLNSDLEGIITGQTGFASANGLDIWYESIMPEGPSAGVVLLNISMAGNALDWPLDFVRTFVESGYQVVRYDYRGTGLSDWVMDWDRKQPYSLADMAGDALAVLDALDIQQAHIVGLSMGGMIAQEIAIQQPERVASLTLMMTSGDVTDPDLPGLTSRYFIGLFVRGIPLLKYRLMGGEKNLLKERIAKMLTVFRQDELDIKAITEIALYDLRQRRGVSIKAIFQHQAAVTVSGSRHEKLQAVNVPTLVIHGTADQFIPVEHGEKLVDIIPNAKGMWLEDVGHIFPFPNMDDIQRTILSHFQQS